MRAAEAIIVLVLLAIIAMAVLTALGLDFWRRKKSSEWTIEVIEISAANNGVYLVKGNQRSLVRSIPKGDDIELEVALRDAKRTKQLIES